MTMIRSEASARTPQGSGWLVDSSAHAGLAALMLLSSCVSGTSPQTITIEHKPDGTTKVEIKRPGVAEQAVEGAVSGGLAAIKKLFGG